MQSSIRTERNWERINHDIFQSAFGYLLVKQFHDSYTCAQNNTNTVIII